MKKRTIWTVVGLVFLSAVIYGIQIFVFKDIKTTEFYILQDLAFVPISFAITTIVVGQIMDDRQKAESEHKTRMLTSTFFTGLGSQLFEEISKIATMDISPNDLLCEDEKKITEQLRRIEEENIQIQINKEGFENIEQLIQSAKMELMELASNPLLLEQECFTQLLWGLFHLLDEFRLRGVYDQLSEADIAHYNSDIEKMFRLLLKNWVKNSYFVHSTYPNFYGAVKERITKGDFNETN